MNYRARVLLLALATHSVFALGNEAVFSSAKAVVSLDYCADQYVLKLLNAERILAISPDSVRDFSYMREAARSHKKVRSVAEDVLVLSPDLVVRTYGGGPNAAHFFRRLDLPVLQIGYANSIEAIKLVIQQVADQLGVTEKGIAIVAEMDDRLAALPVRENVNETLYVTPGGVTGGPGTLVDEMIRAAGLSNFQSDSGWRSLPLEKMAYRQPEMIATAFYSLKINYQNFWSAARHPIIRAQLGSKPSVSLDAATTACGGWFILDAIEALASTTSAQEQ